MTLAQLPLYKMRPGSFTCRELRRCLPASRSIRSTGALSCAEYAADDSGPIVRLSSVETRTCRSRNGLGSVHNLTCNPLSPISWILFDLPHEPSRDRTGGACALLPRADRVWVDPEKPREHNLAHAQEVAHPAHILGAYKGRTNSAWWLRTVSRPGNGSPDRMTSIASWKAETIFAPAGDSSLEREGRGRPAALRSLRSSCRRAYPSILPCGCTSAFARAGGGGKSSMGESQILW